MGDRRPEGAGRSGRATESRRRGGYAGHTRRGEGASRRGVDQVQGAERDSERGVLWTIDELPDAVSVAALDYRVRDRHDGTRPYRDPRRRPREEPALLSHLPRDPDSRFYRPHSY